MSNVAIIISPNYKDYAKRHLKDCIESLRRQNYTGQIHFFIIDNATTEASYKFLKETAPEAEIIRNTDNNGFAKSNNSAIHIALGMGVITFCY
jgi:GT2 family glycosyltransferase